MSLLYYIKNGEIIRGGYSYGELAQMTIFPHYLIKRGENGHWIPACQCVEIQEIAPCSSVAEKVDDIQMDSINRISRPLSGNTYLENYNLIEDEKNAAESEYIVNTHDRPDFMSDSYQRIFIPTAEYFKCKHKRKAAIIGIFTLGIAVVTLFGIVNIWRDDIFAGTSISQSNSGIAFVLKCMSFFLLLTIMAIPYFIYSVLALIYYSFRLYALKHQ